jgi:hypothetical protein
MREYTRIPLDVHTTYLFNRLPLTEKVGIQNAWLIFAVIAVALLIPVLLLIFFGAYLRNLPCQSPPSTPMETYPEDSQ